jgi:hypothetical protein
MLVGHFAVGLTAKRLEPAISFGTAAFAAMLADVLAFILVAAGIERFRIATDVQHNRFVGENIVWSHSLLMDIPATLIVEGGFWLLATALYVRATRATGRAGIYVFWAGVALLTLAWLNNIGAAPPPGGSGIAAALPSLVFFALAIAWAYWMNRARTTQA